MLPSDSIAEVLVLGNGADDLHLQQLFLELINLMIVMKEIVFLTKSVMEQEKKSFFSSKMLLTRKKFYEKHVPYRY